MIRSGGAGARGALVACVAALVMGVTASLPAPASAQAPPDDAAQRVARGQDPAQPTPALAYYYIWYNASSWNRAKTDYPRAGRYSSDQPSVMREHIKLAKGAGITGFMVSWKSTPVLDARLQQLIEVAEEESFGLSIVYQGLDFERRPLPAPRVAADLDLFVEKFASSPAFKIFDKPMVVWSGTWNFTTAEIELVTTNRRDSLLILASARNPKEYNEIAHAVDGDAYYWGAANPATYEKYDEKLTKMAAAAHAGGGLWIAPAAPGFDARLVGGETIVEREDGDMFRRQLNAALSSSPDALGIISWNEFSENSHVEPSEKYGTTALNVLQDTLSTAPPGGFDFDSNGPPGQADKSQRALLMGTLAIVAFLGAMVLARRRLKARDLGPPVPTEASSLI